MHTIHINNVTKNASYDHYFQLWTAGNNPSGMMTGVAGLTGVLKISKDGGAYADTTNSVVEIGSGLYKITLTSTEMNADVVNIYKAGSNSTHGGHHAMIVTGLVGSGGGGMALTDTVTDITSLADDNPSIREVLSLIWQIIRKGEKRDRKTLKQILKSGI